MYNGLKSYEFEQFVGEYYESIQLDIEYSADAEVVEINNVFNAETGGEFCLLYNLWEEVHSSVCQDIDLNWLKEQNDSDY